MSFKHKPGLPFIWNCFTQWSKQIRINNTGYLCRVTKIKYYQAIEQREQKNDTYLQNCIKTILLSENFLTANQNSSKTVKGLNHFSTFLFLLWHWPSNYLPYWVCIDLVTMPCCFQAPPQWCCGYKPPVLRLLVIVPSFFLSNQTTQNQEMHMMLNENTKRGWPNHRGRKIGLTAILLPTYKIVS